jgi:hypothetical protein
VNILAEPRASSKDFAFATKNNIPLYYCSASTGVNVVKVSFLINYSFLSYFILFVDSFDLYNIVLRCLMMPLS